MSLAERLATAGSAVIRQKKELAELVGFETRNKYEILDEKGQPLAWCAEKQDGFMGLLARQLLGHWRTFELTFFETDRRPALRALHPFRWFFQCLEVETAEGKPLGRLEQRFAVFSKRFDLHDPSGGVRFEMRSGFLSFWTFPVTDAFSGQRVAVIRKKWSGALREIFLDADNFQLELTSPSLTKDERLLLLAAAIFVDLQYFENKGGGGLSLLGD